MVELDLHTNTKDLDKNLKLQVFPSDLHDKFKEVIIDYWDLFCEDGFSRPIWGFPFQIDTYNHLPI